MGIGDWGLGIGDWAQSPIPNPQSPIPNVQEFDKASTIKSKINCKVILYVKVLLDTNIMPICVVCQIGLINPNNS